MSDCPNCGASNSPNDTFCRFCGADLRSTPTVQQPPQTTQPSYPPPQASSSNKQCPFCGSTNPSNYNNCGNCGSPLTQQAYPPTQPSYPPQSGIQQPPYQQPDYQQPPKKHGFFYYICAWPFLCLGYLCNPCNTRRRSSGCDCGCSGSDCSGCDCGDCDGCDCT